MPTSRTGLAPVVLYIHGGAFHYLSKDTHWVLALMFARRGYVVFNIDYRLAPVYPYSAAIEDVSIYMQAIVGSGGNDKELSNLKVLTFRK